MNKILLVEDDIQIAKSLCMNLKLNGFDVNPAGSLKEAWERLGQMHFDLLLLDVNLPDGNGFDLCQKIRQMGNDVPVLFLSARTDEATVVKSMNMGGDDYIRKPYGTEELKVRIMKLLKRFPNQVKLITFGQLAIDTEKRQVKICDKAVSLGRRELDILIILAKRAGNVVTREKILSYLQESNEVYDRTIDSHISHLRKKLKDVTDHALQISSIYGVGYRLEWVA